MDIRNGTQPDDLAIGKRTCASGCFDFYEIEMTNKSTGLIRIRKFGFQLNNESSHTTLKTFKDFSAQVRLDDEPLMLPEQTKTFLFEYAKDNKLGSRHKFISLRPFLYYDINNESKLMVLPTAIYSPFGLNDDEVKEMIKNM